MPPVSTTSLYSFSPRGAAAVAHQETAAFGGTPSTSRRRPPMAGSLAEVGPLRILAVEPDARTRSLLEVGLARAGFTVIAARSVAEAQELIGVGRALPAMVVCETDLQGEDGFRFCGRLRADLRTAQVPVVMLSQRPEAFHLEMAGGTGVDDYLPKPVFLNDVVALAKLKAGETASQAAYDADSARLPIGELLRALLAGMRSGRIELQDGTARLTFRQGQVVDCKLEGVRGARALSRMLLLARGPYQVTFGPPGPALGRGTLCVDLRELCRSVLPDLARSRKAQERSLPLEAVLQPDTARLREVLPDLPDGVNSLVRLFDGERTLKQVILRCELPEASALLISTRLYGLGALGPESPRELEHVTVTPLAVVTLTSPDSLEQALAAIAERSPAPLLTLAPPAPEPRPAPEAPAPAPVAPAEPARPYLRAQLQDDFADRLDEALQRAAAATAQAALTPPKTSIVDVHYFASKRPSGAITQPLPIVAPRARRWWRSAQAKVAAGALALFIGSAAVGSVLFRPAAPEALAPETSAPAASRFPALPDWLAPRAVGTAESWVTLGRRRYDDGDLEGAKAAAVQALAVDPQSGPALLLLATIHYGMNQPVEAKEALRRYLVVDPGGRFASEARNLIER